MNFFLFRQMGKPETGSKTSNVWKYFIKVKKSNGKGNSGNSICKICNKEVKTSGNTTNQKNHLKRNHSTVFEKMKRLTTPASSDTDGPGMETDLSQSSQSQYMQTDTDTEDSDEESRNDEKKPSVSNPRILQTEAQSRIDNCFKNLTSMSSGPKSHAITDSILFYIVSANLPLSTTENDGFKKLMKTVAPLYKVPCRKTITKLLDEKYELCLDSLKTALRNVQYYSITCDIWTDTLNTISYLGITAHYIDFEVIFLFR